MAVLTTDARFWRARCVARPGCNIARLFHSTQLLLGTAVPPQAVTVLLTDPAPAASPQDPPASPPIPPTPVLGPTTEGPSITDIEDLQLPPPLLGTGATPGAKCGPLVDNPDPLNTALKADLMDYVRAAKEAVSASGFSLCDAAGVYLDASLRSKSDRRPSPHNGVHSVPEYTGSNDLLAGKACTGLADDGAKIQGLPVFHA
ncbi:hypothetical protein C8Q76DRAFT_802399 [Earliella scabrosa]|nr:hypothetical protein C8Q76DRAFT_802399 [Earliella scabrosa]